MAFGAAQAQPDPARNGSSEEAVQGIDNTVRKEAGGQYYNSLNIFAKIIGEKYAWRFLLKTLINCAKVRS
jgi:hypothetical protein